MDTIAAGEGPLRSIPGAERSRAGAPRSIDSAVGTSDQFTALAAGPRAWANAERTRSVTERLSLALVTLGVALLVVTLGAFAGLNLAGLGFPQRASLFASGAVIAIAVARDSALLRRRVVDHRPLWVRVCARCIGLAAFAVAWLSLGRVWAGLALWPMSLIIGSEAFLTSEFLGLRADIRRLWLAYLVSPVHLGVVTAVSVVLVSSDSSVIRRSAMATLIGIELTAVASCLVWRTCQRVRDAELQHIDRARIDERDAERRRRAHWIHDDVCAEVRGIKMMAATQTLDQEQISRALDELDHRLRLRQLHEVLSGGRASIAEILQPYLRRLQSQGILLTSVPRFEDASVIVAGRPADLVRRSIAGLTANAVNAGARAVAVRTMQRPGFVVVEVEDDAGGFDWSNVPPGRRLSSLETDLGSGRLTIRRTTAGACVRAEIDLTSGATNG